MAKMPETGSWSYNTEGCNVPDMLDKTRSSVLFDVMTHPGTIYSPHFSVTPGETILVSAFNMPDNKRIYTNKIIRSAYGNAVCGSCEPCGPAVMPSRGSVISYRERMCLGGDQECWTMIKFSNTCATRSRLQLMITIPGIYELQLEDTEMIGDLYVEMVAWPTDLVGPLPMDYYAGVCSPCVGN